MSSEHTILVVEDDPDIRDSLCDVLEAEGYRVVGAANGREGLDRLRTSGAVCLVLLDLMMPVMGGAEFLANLRSTSVLASLPVVIVSAWPSEASSLRDQTQGFVRKPVALAKLLGVVERFCSPGTVAGPPGGAGAPA